MLLRNYAGDTFREGRVSFSKQAFTFPRVAFLSKLELHFLQKTFCEEMLVPANMQNFIDTILNL